MRATARRPQEGLAPEVEIGSFRFAAGAPTDAGAAQGAPAPQELLAASLAACSTLAIEAYAKRKGWDIGEVVVEVDFEMARRGSPARCGMVVRLPEHVPEEQRRRLMAIGATSPVRRSLEGETMFDERLELEPAPPGRAAGQAPRASERNRLRRRLRRRHPSTPQ